MKVTAQANSKPEQSADDAHVPRTQTSSGSKSHSTSRKWLLGAACALLAATVGPAFAEIYKTVDANGNVTFTDVPPAKGKNAKTVNISTPNTMDAPRLTPTTRSSSSVGEQQLQGYEEISILRPTNDQAVRDNAGNVFVQGQLVPELQSGHLVRFVVDGAEAKRSPSASVQLENLDRGTHTVQMEIVDAAGVAVATSAPTTFHLLRYSQNFQRPQAKRGG